MAFEIAAQNWFR